MDVRRRISPAGGGAHGDRGELLDVREKRDIELRAPEDDLAGADLAHHVSLEIDAKERPGREADGFRGVRDRNPSLRIPICAE
jgi:hypothetical protein